MVNAWRHDEGAAYRRYDNREHSRVKGLNGEPGYTFKGWRRCTQRNLERPRAKVEAAAKSQWRTNEEKRRHLASRVGVLISEHARGVDRALVAGDLCEEHRGAVAAGLCRKPDHGITLNSVLWQEPSARSEGRIRLRVQKVDQGTCVDAPVEPGDRAQVRRRVTLEGQ